MSEVTMPRKENRDLDRFSEDYMVSLDDPREFVIVQPLKNMSEEIKQAALSVVLTLQRSLEAELLKASLLRLKENLKNDVFLEYMVHQRVNELLLNVMVNLETDMDIQLIGLEVMEYLLQIDEILEREIQSSDLYKHVLNILTDYQESELMQCRGMRVLANLMESEDLRNQSLVDDLFGNLADAVFVAMEKYKSNVDIQIQALRSTLHLLIEDHDIQEAFMKSHFNLIMEIVHIHKDNSAVIKHVFDILEYLAGNDNTRLQLLERETDKLVVETFSSMKNVLEMEECSCRLLLILSDDVRTQKALLESNFMQKTMVPLMQNRDTSVTVQKTGLELFCLLGKQLFESEENVTKLSYLWCGQIFQPMIKIFNNSEIQISACKALSTLMEVKPEANQWIGDNTINSKTQLPLHSMCLGDILMFQKDCEVFSAACEAIYWLAADNERICENLMEKNAHVAVLDGVRRHILMAVAVESALRALRGLCIFHGSYKLDLIVEGIQSHLTKAFIIHVHDPSVQIECISTVACLADVEFFCNQCFVEKIHIRILKSLKMFCENELMQEAGLECLAVLSTAEKASELLNCAGAISHVVAVLKKFNDTNFIQRKGLILLQLLAEPRICNDGPLCVQLAEIVDRAMMVYNQDIGILKEACVAVQLLSETGKAMKEFFVQEYCHERMFEILAEHHDSDLVDLAGECLVVLGLDESIKAKMLFAECGKGNIMGVQCLLEMEADVNYIQDNETPLSQAVKNGDEQMVRLLLKAGANDMVSSIRRSLKLGTHVITGLLLGKLCHGREGSHIPWSGLGLGAQEFNPEWFAAIFSKQQESISSSSSDLRSLAYSRLEDAGKNIISKLKHSENKRIQRHKSQMIHSKSDSQIAGDNRHKFFRFNCDINPTLHEEKRPRVRRKSMPQVLRVIRTSSKSNQLKDSGCSSPQEIEVHINKSLSPIVSPRASADNSLNNTSDSLSNSDTDDYVPVFETSYAEAEEWKSMTLTGAKVPFSPADPRCKSSSEFQVTSITGNWRRKTRSRSPSAQSLQSLQVSTESPTLSFDEVSQKLPKMIYLPVPGLSSDSESSDVGRNFGRTRTRMNSGESIFSDSEKPMNLRIDSTDFTSMDLSCNAIKSLKGLLESEESYPANFQHIEKFYLNENHLQALPQRLFDFLPQLQIVDIRHNKLRAFPTEILRCKNLTTLDLSHNEISEMEIFENTSLLELNLNSNKLTSIPQDICNCLPAVETLNLNSNQIKVLDEDQPLGLTNLRKLGLSYNYIKTLPERFLSECTKLDSLEMAHNDLEKLPSEAASQMLQKLSRVKLQSNKISGKEPWFIPKFILDLQSLRCIDLRENCLTGLPKPTAWRSSMLKEIFLSNNNIPKISLEGAKALSKLESLHLSRTGLLELPKEIGQLSSLTSLDISHNPLTSLPDELGRCSKMWEMPLHNLELGLDHMLTKGKVKDLIVYLHNRLKRATEYYRMKMMVIGYGGRGKTTMLRALMKNYKPANVNQPTVGVIVKDWKFERQRRDGRGTVMYTLNTWDFAGQEEFYSTHQCYLSNRALYLVVCNMKEGVKEIDLLKPWLSNIKARAPGCPVILVMTHFDKIPDDKKEAVLDEMRAQIANYLAKPGFPDIRSIVPVMCTRENQSVEDLRNVIKGVIDEYKMKGQPVMGQKVPASYVKLSDLLADEARLLEKSYPVISRNRLLRIVQDANLDLDEDELDQAVRFLHESGVLLHYCDKTLNLKDLYFIDPGWLCRMMAQIVTVRQINPFIKNGILKKSDTKLLFTGKKVDKENSFVFPQGLIPQYLKLLEKFEIALPHSEDELLIPCHLPEAIPDLQIPTLARDEKIGRFYTMPYVPLGMWSRLITRLIVFSKSLFTEVLVQQQGHPDLTYWNKGIYIFWSEEAFCLMESCTEEDLEEIHFTVPATKPGATLLGLVADHIDALIEEWYPGLTTVDPLHGKELLEKFVPCVKCNAECPKLFTVESLLKQSETSLEVWCDKCFQHVPLALMAPDIVMSDIHPSLQVDLTKLDFRESAESLLGDGGYGAVYRGTYNGQGAAVKVFSAIGDIHPHKMLRQEATVLRCLNHPSVVSMLAVCLHPRAIVMELAHLGSLSQILKDTNLKPLSRPVQHRIALQVAEGLAYLHKLMLIYRDMKPDNVLIFSLSLSATVNAKISDYGISRFSTLDGLMAQEGTPAYRAPEVIRGETYSYKADVFSFGITLYALVTGGRHPFDELDFKSEMDRVVAEGQCPPPITQKGCSPWPSMQTILTSCLHQLPDKRPHSYEVWEELKNPEILGLKRIIPISIGTTVECFAIQEQECGKVYLWVASGDSEYVQLSRLDLMNHTSEIKGAMFRYGRILCLQPLNQGYLLVGTQMSRIWLYDTNRNEYQHCTSILPDAVLCIKVMRLSGNANDDLIFAGLANGTISVFPQSEILYEPNTNPMCLSPGQTTDAVRCLVVESWRRCIYASCGSKIVVLSTKKGIALEKVIETIKDRRQSPIYCLAVGKSHLYVSHKGSPVIQVWELGNKEKLRHQFNVAATLGLGNVPSRITSLAFQAKHGILWVGTGDGHIVLLDSKSGKAIVSTHIFSGAVRFMQYVKPYGATKFSAVLSGGLGFKDGGDKPSKRVTDDECGCVAVWETGFSTLCKELEEDLKKRANYVETSSKKKVSQILESPTLSWKKIDRSVSVIVKPETKTENEMFASL